MLGAVPELPEVETVRRQLAPLVIGRRIVDTWAHASPKFTPAIEATGRGITDVLRAGKYLLVGLDDGNELVVHLGMTGRLRVGPADVDDAYVRARWHLDDGNALEYRDVRRFGRLRVLPAGHYVGMLAVQGPDALDLDFDGDGLWRALRRSRRGVKAQLLSQRPIAGVGNIYADEALWLARIHPTAQRLSRARATELLDAIRTVLSTGVSHRGTTLRDYRAVDGAEGANQRHLECYGRVGHPCSRCGTTLRRTIVAGRGTTHCPRCQRR
jgi:formamidopyrimidine-DNA glycosylase